jgi:hypothetical protein
VKPGHRPGASSPLVASPEPFETGRFPIVAE